MSNDVLKPMQAVAIYRHGISIFSQTEAVMLRWTTDDRIQLIRPSETTEENIFDTHTEDIQKIGGSENMLNFHIDNKVYRLTLLSDASEQMNQGIQTLEAIKQYRSYRPVKMQHWLSRLKLQHIRMTYINLSSIFVWSASLFGVFALVALALYIFEAI